jgi:hypothetical protein
LVHDARLFFQNQVDNVERKSFLINEKIQYAEMVVRLKEQLQELKETKENIEETYKLQQKVREDLKKVGAIADGGFPALINASEVILGKTLNTAYYIPDIEEIKEFRQNINYDASQMLSPETRFIHRDIFKFNPNWVAEGKNKMSLTTNLSMLGESMTGLITMEKGMEDYRQRLEAESIEQKLKLARINRKISQELIQKLTEEGAFELTAGERTNLLIQAMEMGANATELEKEAAIAMEKELESKMPSDERMINIFKESINIQIDYTLSNVISKYSKNKGFSLSEFENSYQQNGGERPKLQLNKQN